MRTAAKKDSNHNDIKSVLESFGISVKDVHQLKEFCDMVVTFHEMTELVEVKDGNKKLTDGEQKFHNSWPSKVHIIRSKNEAVLFSEWLKRKAALIPY